MKRKLIYILTFIICFNFFVSSSFAASCSNDELYEINKDAANIKITIEPVSKVTPIKIINDDGEEVEEDLDDEYLEIKILNLSDKFYLKMQEDFDSTTKTYTSANAVDGVITIEWRDTSKITNILSEIYTSTNTGCPNKKVLTLKNTIPKLNEYYNTGYCDTHSKNDYCQMYITFDISDEDFQRMVNSNEKEARKAANESSKEIVKKEKSKKEKELILKIGAVSAGVILLSTIVVLILRKRRRLL